MTFSADRGSATPIMMGIVAVAVVVASMSALLGREFTEAVRLQSAADAVALALATGDRELAGVVASSNSVQIVEESLVGDPEMGFEAMVTVAAGDSESRARASTRLDHVAGADAAVPESGQGVLR
ncbi:MAG: hypothetical protein ACKOBT_02695 [Actinomycetota bacterium]